MLSIFAFTLLLNVVLALPSPRRPEPSFSVSDIGRMIHATGGEVKARQTATNETLSMPITCDIVHCTAQIGIGIPPVEYTVLLDTGSSNTWIGAEKAFNSASSTVLTGQNVSVVYGSGNFSGFEVRDTVTLGPGLVIQGQSIGIATQSSGFGNGVDGILGLGLTEPTTDSGTVIPTVLDNLKNQGIIDSRVFGISSQPIGQSDSVPGSIIFGGTNSNDLTSEVAFFPNTKSTVAGVNNFWALDVNITYGDTASLMLDRPAIVDLGTSVLALNDEAFQAYQKATGGVPGESGLLTITPSQFGNLQPLHITTSQNTYTLSPNAQILPRKPDSDPTKITLLVSSLGPGNQTVGAIIGAYAMHYFFTAFDADHSLVGIATNEFTNAIVT